jgi:hypothetical protein
VRNHTELSSGGSDSSNPLEIAIFSASDLSIPRMLTSEGSTGPRREARSRLSRSAPPLVATEMASEKVALARENRPCDQVTYRI